MDKKAWGTENSSIVPWKKSVTIKGDKFSSFEEEYKMFEFLSLLYLANGIDCSKRTYPTEYYSSECLIKFEGKYPELKGLAGYISNVTT